jgi:hypothetical protein
MSKIKPYFDREIKSEIVQALKNARYSIRVAMFSLNEDSLFRLLCHKAEKDKIQVEVLLDTRQYLENKSRLSETIARLEKNGGSVFLYENIKGEYANMHHKFCIIDDKILITGSYNWTNNASKNNDENIVIIDDVPVCFEFGKKFNALKQHENAYLQHEEVDLPIFLTTSRNVVKENEEVEISWNVPNADIVTLNGMTVDNSGTIKKRIEKNEKFILWASSDNGNEASKIVSVTIAGRPVIKSFISNERVIRQGESIVLSWEVKDAIKVEIDSFGEVSSKDSREHKPQENTTYKLIAYDVWGEELIKELFVRVIDFKVPTIETIAVKVPQIDSNIKFEIKKPVFSQSITRDSINKILDEQNAIMAKQNNQINQLKRNKTDFFKELKKSIKDKSIKIQVVPIKRRIFKSLESILTIMLAKLQESKYNNNK